MAEQTLVMIASMCVPFVEQMAVLPQYPLKCGIFLRQPSCPGDTVVCLTPCVWCDVPTFGFASSRTVGELSGLCQQSCREIPNMQEVLR